MKFQFIVIALCCAAIQLNAMDVPTALPSVLQNEYRQQMARVVQAEEKDRQTYQQLIPFLQNVMSLFHKGALTRKYVFAELPKFQANPNTPRAIAIINAWLESPGSDSDELYQFAKRMLAPVSKEESGPRKTTADEEQLAALLAMANLRNERGRFYQLYMNKR